MSNKGKITEIIDTQATKKQSDELIAQLTNVINKMIELTEVTAKAGVNLKKSGTFQDMSAGLNETQKAQKAGNDLMKETIRLEAENERIKVKIAASTGELAKENARLKAQQAEANKQAKQAIQDEKNAVGSINARAAALAKLRAEYKALSEAERNSASGKAMLKSIQEQDAAIKSLDASTGLHQRNVGNYTSALEGLPGPIGAAVSGFKSLGLAMWKLVANPVGAIIAAIALALMGLYKAFTSTDEGGDKLAGVFKALSGVMKVVFDRIEYIRKAMIDLFTFDWSGFKTNASNAFSGIGESMKDAAKAGDDYIQTIAALDDIIAANSLTIKRLEKDVDKLRFITKNQNLSDQERLKAARDVMKIERQIADIRVKQAEELFNAEMEYVAGTIQIAGASTVAKKLLLGQILKMNGEELKSEIEKGGIIKEMYDKSGEMIVKLSNLKGEVVDAEASFFRENRRTQSELTSFEKALETERIARIKKGSEDLKKATQEDIQTRTKVLKHEQQLANLQAEIYKEATENEYLSYDERLSALEDFLTHKQEAGEAAMWAELMAVEEGSEEALAIAAKFQEESDKLTREGNGKRLKLNQDAMTAATEAALAMIEIQSAEELIALNDRYAAGLMSAEDYEKERAEIMFNASRDILLGEITAMEQELAVFAGTAEAKAKIESDLAKLRMQLSQEATDKQIQDSQTSKEKFLETATEVQQYAEQMIGAIAGLYNSIHEGRKQQIEAELEEITEQKDRELEMAGDNEEQKTQIEARFAARKEAIDARMRALDIKKAKFDKAAAMAGIAMNTAQALIQLWVKPGFPAAIPLAVMVGAIGAMQLAAVAASPLPKYKHGTRDHRGGAAIVAEAGRELIQLPTGESFLTPSKDTLVDLPAHSKVFSNAELRRMAEAGAIPELGGSVVNRNSPGWMEVTQAVARVERAIDNRPEYRTILTKEGLKQTYVNGKSETEYIHNSIRK